MIAAILVTGIGSQSAFAIKVSKTSFPDGYKAGFAAGKKDRKNDNEFDNKPPKGHSDAYDEGYRRGYDDAWFRGEHFSSNPAAASSSAAAVGSRSAAASLSSALQVEVIQQSSFFNFLNSTLSIQVSSHLFLNYTRYKFETYHLSDEARNNCRCCRLRIQLKPMYWPWRITICDSWAHVTLPYLLKYQYSHLLFLLQTQNHLIF